MTENIELIQKIYEWIEKHTDKIRNSFNSDKKALKCIFGELAVKLEKPEVRYCPCRMTTGVEENERKIVYPYIYL